MRLLSARTVTASVARRIARYEEAEALADEQGKNAGQFRLGALFPNIADTPLDGSFDGHCEVRAAAVRFVDEASSRYSAGTPQPVVALEGTEGSFPSLVANGTVNDIARFSYFPARNAKRKPAVVVLHHWNADPSSYRIFGELFSRLGISAAVMTLPHHGSRGDGSAIANRFLNADVSNTIRSMTQSVLDVQVIVDWLADSRARTVGLLGLSLGSPVAALAAAFNPKIRAAALLLTAGDFASVVWSGRATRHIRQAMEGHITLESLQLLWGIISPGRFADRLARSRIKLLILSGIYDQVVLPELTSVFVDQLEQAGADVTHRRCPCGHYSLGMQPFASAAFIRSFAFLWRSLHCSRRSARVTTSDE